MVDPRLARLISSPRRDAPRIVCQGLLASDFVTRTGFPVPRDRKVRVKEFVRQGGGPAANAAVAIARLGGRTVFQGAVGDDALGAEQRKELADEGVDVSGVEILRGAASFVCFILVDEADGARTIVSAPHARPLPRGATDPFADGADLLLVDGWGGPATRDAVRAARARGIPVLLDAGSARDDVLFLLDSVDVVIASEPFADEWAGTGRPEEAIARLLGLGARMAAVTRGPRGALAGAAGSPERFEVPAFPVAAVDTTGAGDAFHGGAAWALATGRPWEESLRIGAFVAARKCLHAGARGGLPRRADLAAGGFP